MVVLYKCLNCLLYVLLKCCKLQVENECSLDKIFGLQNTPITKTQHIGKIKYKIGIFMKQSSLSIDKAS